MLFTCNPHTKSGEFTAELVTFGFGYVFKQFWRYHNRLRKRLRISFNTISW